ncbi:MAG: response regulator [Campylobacteraceae bacterium]
MKVFMIESDIALNKNIKNTLQQFDFFVDSFFDGYSSYGILINKKYDIYIIDLNSNSYNAFDLIEMIRKSNQNAIILAISIDGGIKNITKAYEAGCNDFVKKPFDTKELIVRINYHNSFQPKSDCSKNSVKINEFLYFNTLTSSLLYKDKEVVLTKKEKLFLSILINQKGLIVLGENLRQYVWDDKDIKDVTVRSLAFKINKKVGEIIKSVRGVGYMIE